MKLISWNVNGLRAVHKKGEFLSLIANAKPDVLCLQEIKANEDQLPDEVRGVDGYHAVFNSAEKKGYSGVAVYSKEKPLAVELGIGDDTFDTEGRIIMAEFDAYCLINTYLPSGSSGDVRQGFKLAVLPHFLDYCASLAERGKPVAICGDMNIAHRAIDLARPKQNKQTSGFTPEERAWMDGFLEAGFVDTFRQAHPEQADAYSWWSYRGGNRARNVGWRLDYWFVSENLRDSIKNAVILNEIMGSDHCPVQTELTI